jgi:integrative and conjugative element protein (TIGR02256 family)
VTNVEFWTEDRSFGLRITKFLLDELHNLCQQTIPNETGGIIIGFYTEALDCAVVTAFSKPPEDSMSGRNWFYRGIKGLQSRLNQLWLQRKQYYLGEWHFHPYGVPNPSSIDIEQMYNIASDTAYHCPEPLLVILGGDPMNKWSIKGYVFQRDKGLQELLADNS